MLEHVPAWLGGLLKNVRAGHAKLVIAHRDIAGAAVPIDLSSPAFANGARLPARFTADGPGVSPPLVWGRLPAATASVALIVEDADAPAVQPLVHAIVWNIAPGECRLAEGAMSEPAPREDVGRNSFLRPGWLPPDPPTGHGGHDYVFQLFALDARIGFAGKPGRGAFVEAIMGHVLAVGLLIGTYSRGASPSIEAGSAGAGDRSGSAAAA